MASTLRVPLTVDLGDLFQELQSVELGLGKVLKAALKDAGDLAARRTAELFPRGPGPQSAKDNLPHIADTITGYATQSYAQVVSDHPAAPVINFGGTISPRGVEIFFPTKLYAQQAGEQVLPQIQERLQGEIDRLTAEHLS